MTRTLLIDMDQILVKMVQPWLERYNQICSTNIKEEDIKEYNVGLVCKDEKVLYGILDEPEFFYNMKAMPGAVACMQTLVNDGYDVVILTRPPENSGPAISEKQKWIKERFPSFTLNNMAFMSRKELVWGDLLFDDCPDHLKHWSKKHPDGKLATLDWLYNKDVKVDFRGALDGSGWVNFVEFVRKTLPLK